MAGNDTAALVVALSAQVSKFQKDMDEAVGIADRSTRRIEERFSQLNFGKGIDDFINKMKVLAAGAGLGVIINGLIDINREAAKIGETAELIGATTDELQKFRFGVVATGGSISDADRFLERFSRSMGDAAKGSGDLYNFLRANGIAAREFVKLPLGEQLEKFANLIKNTSTQAERLNNVFLVGGRGSAQLVQLLQEGAEGMRRFGQEAQDAGAVLDSELVKRAKELNIQLEKLKLSISVEGMDLVISAWQKFGEIMTDVGTAVGHFLNNFESLRHLGIPQILINKPSPPGEPPPGGGNGSTIQPDAQAESFQKLITAQQRRIALLGAEQDAIGKTAGEEASYKALIDLIYQAKQQQIPLDDKRLQQLQDEANRTGQAAQALDDYKRQWAGLNSAVQFAGDQLSDILTGLETKTLSLADAAKQLQNALLRALNSALLTGSGPLAGLFGLQSNVPGGTGGLLGALFSGFRASGGPVSGGRGYVVGENGPEFFVPDSSGRIIPSNIVNRTGEVGTIITYAPVIDARGADAQAVARLASALAEDKRTFESRVKSTVSRWRSNTPGAF
jgi:hypothetical protein